MEKWVGTIIGAVFIVALGYGVYMFFGGSDLNSKSGNNAGVIGRIGAAIERGCSKVLTHVETIDPQHFSGVWAGFINMLGAIVE